MVKTTFIFCTSEHEARKKIRDWHQDKKNLQILSAIPKQKDDKGYEVTFSYDDE